MSSDREHFYSARFWGASSGFEESGLMGCVRRVDWKIVTDIFEKLDLLPVVLE
jgi:hypothetical protein